MHFYAFRFSLHQLIKEHLATYSYPSIPLYPFLRNFRVFCQDNFQCSDQQSPQRSKSSPIQNPKQWSHHLKTTQEILFWLQRNDVFLTSENFAPQDEENKKPSSPNSCQNVWGKNEVETKDYYFPSLLYTRVSEDSYQWHNRMQNVISNLIDWKYTSICFLDEFAEPHSHKPWEMLWRQRNKPR